MIVELHIIQNFAPSNLNRDDTNAPKDCEFGGFRRARISSQCIKRATRNHQAFKKSIQEAGGDMAIRTKRIIGRIAEELSERNGRNPEQSQVVAERVMALFGVKKDDKRKDKTKILLYLGENEISEIVKVALRHWDRMNAMEVVVQNEEPEDEADKTSKKKEKKTKLTPEQAAIKKELLDVVSEERLKAGSYAADIALFGRMVADKNVKNMNVDAACQVAHGISTHKVEMEMDYFTAVDDLLPDEETGSDMIGVVEFNSSCFYRYSLIDVDKLRKNLGPNHDLLKATILGYLEAAIKSIPTGKQNSMAAQNPAGYARVVIRKDGFPWSLANAFQKPVRPGNDQSIEEASIAQLDDYFNRMSRTYGNGGIICDATINLYDSKSLPLNQMLENVTAAISKEAIS